MSTVKEAAHRLSKSKMSLYAVLDLKKGASPEDIKKSYEPNVILEARKIAKMIFKR
uniref:DnaJ heat shock protein family (Hsp40) member C5 gamma n=1 Tax=Gorilla gorilla gorilla TaxID=9595 RepID=A0A2I2Y831_GORGO